MEIKNFLYPIVLLVALLMGLAAIIYSERELSQEYENLLQNSELYLILSDIDED